MEFLRAIGSMFGRFFSMLMPYNLRQNTILNRMRGTLDTATEKVMETPGGFWRRFFWFIHFIVIIAIVVGLWFLNSALEFPRILKAPTPGLARVWLPLLFILVYLLGWLGWWLWRLIGPERELDDHPDIDEAWREVRAALLSARIDPTRLPTYLVLGQPAGGFDALFHAAQEQWVVNCVPRRSDSPLHVYASENAVFVTCQGASLSGMHANVLNTQGSAEGTGGLLDSLEAGDVAPILDGAEPVVTERRTHQDVGLTVDDMGDWVEPQASSRRPSLLRDTAVAELQTKRLRYLCRKIVRLREPFSPVNGIVALIPLAATAADTDTSHTASILRHDLATARESLQVQCPVVGLVCDLEQAPGVRELVKFAAERQQKHRLVGQAFPLVPDLDAEQYDVMLADGASWITLALFPTLVYRMLRLDSTDRADRAQVLRDNGHLYQLMALLRERNHRLARILARGLGSPPQGQPLVGGLYMAATGPDAASEQAFVPGVFRQLIDQQNYVAWTPDARVEDADYFRMASMGYVSLLVIALALGGLGYYYWPLLQQ